MTDISLVLPKFQTAPYSHLIAPLERAGISTSELLCAQPADIAKRAQVPPTAAAKLIDAVIDALHTQVCESPLQEWQAISFLDDELDKAWNGGAPTRYVTEITGESGVGKTQFLLTLLLAVQLPPSQGGLARSAIYISTEAALSTARLSQLLSTHPRLSSLPEQERPSLSNVHAIQVPDLEAQDHILRYQVPVAIARFNVGLVVIDSIASNYRAEMDVLPINSSFTQQHPGGGKGNSIAILGERRAHLVKLGTLLRTLATEHNVAIVCSNQVADRFSSEREHHSAPQSSMPASAPVHALGYEQRANSGAVDRMGIVSDVLSLDHQQRFFTGWGDRPFDTALGGFGADKTPALGLVWSNQISARVALVREGRDSFNGPKGTEKRRRWMRIVFASWMGQSVGRGVEYEVLEEGVKAVAAKLKSDDDTLTITNKDE